MNVPTKECPYCGQTITPKKLQAIEAQITADKEKEFRERLETETRRIHEDLIKEMGPRLAVLEAENKRYRAQEKDLRTQQEEVKLAKERIGLEVQKQVAVAQDSWIAEGRKLAAEEMEKIKPRLAITEAELKQYKARETELLTREEEVKDAKAREQLEIKKRVVESQEKWIATGRELAIEEYEIDRKERERRETDLKKKIEEMEAKLATGSPQMRGALQEEDLENQLKRLFPGDDIRQVARSRGGADVLQEVQELSTGPMGVILWESKRTQNWNEGWLAKLREDQRQVKADIAILVSTTLPDDQPVGGLREAVLVLQPGQVEVVAQIVRQSLVHLHQQKATGQQQDDWAGRLLEYLGGKEFNLILTGIAEDLTMLRDLDESEERWMTRILSQRNETRRRLTRRIASHYGALQGILRSLPEVPGLTLLELPAS